MAMDMATLTRWQKAAQRAIASDLVHQLRQRGGSILVPSKSEAGRVYHVAFDGGLVGQCDCQAGLNGKPCAHRAAVLLRAYERATGTRVVSVKPAAVVGFERWLRDVQPAPAPVPPTIAPAPVPATVKVRRQVDLL